jgi:hypothetical protein
LNYDKIPGFAKPSYVALYIKYEITSPVDGTLIQHTVKKPEHIEPMITRTGDAFILIPTMRRAALFIITLLVFAVLGILSASAQDIDNTMEEDPVNNSISYAELSKQLVEAVRDGDPHFMYTRMLASVPEDELYQNLATESEKKAFWINIYNAYVQILLLEDPELFVNRNSWFGYNFFSSPQITIAGNELSFDDIEHGIMRRSKIKISLGYLNSWSVDEFVERFWWDEIDPRIHFVLNCGAASCPYIAPFDPDRVEEQLRLGAKEHLEDTTDYSAEENDVEVTRLISWFRGDFGGVSGAIEMIKSYGIIPQESEPSVNFKEYDWTLELGNYKEL